MKHEQLAPRFVYQRRLSHLPGLLRGNPFPASPPRYIRAWLYEYRFTTAAERAQTGAWWKRERLDLWFPPISLDRPGFRDALREQGWQ